MTPAGHANQQKFFVARLLERRRLSEATFESHLSRPGDGLSSAALTVGAYDFCLCGRTEMIRDITRIVDDRVSDSRLFSEAFF